MEHYHHQQADVLRLDHPYYVEKLARHVFRGNRQAIQEVHRTFNKSPLPVELVAPSIQNQKFHL